MPNRSQRDVLIECQSCGIENIFNGYLPEQLVLCNQCRDRLVEPNLQEICNQFECLDCGFEIIVLKKTPFILGDSTCRCGSKNIKKVETILIYQDAVKAGAFDDAPPTDGDWYRSEPVTDDMENYNKLFDNDLGNDS